MRKTKDGLTYTVFAAVAAAAFFISALSIPVEAASPGAFDPSFGTAGKVVTTVGGSEAARGVTVQSDGKVIVVGSADLGSGDFADFFVVRFNTNGTLDPTFSGDGRVFTNFSGVDAAFDAVVQTDGKIVVVGTSSGGQISAFARYLPNGTLDSTFDGDGKFTLDVIAGTEETLESAALQADGKIVSAGSVGAAAAANFLLVRLTSAGAPDTTFSGDGIFNDNLGGSDLAHDVVVLPDGRIVAAGESTAAGTNDFALASYNSGGTRDNSFDTDGLVLTDFNKDADRGFSLAVQVDGKIVAGGGAHRGSGFFNSDFGVARYNPNGSLDATFDTDGKVIAEFGDFTFNFARNVAIDSEGKIVAGGVFNSQFPLLMRFNPDGSLDTGFSEDGIVLTSFFPLSSLIRTGTMFGDKYVLIGQAGSDIGVMRFNLLKAPTETGDFDGDGFTDSTVFRPSIATWFTLNSSDNTVTQERFGLEGDQPIDGDFDGDGRADLCIFRPSNGVWFFLRSSTRTTLGATFGQAGDKPVAGDYDKDGKTDIAVWRPSNQNFFVLRSSSNFSNFFSYPFGAPGDIPVQAAAQ